MRLLMLSFFMIIQVVAAYSGEIDLSQIDPTTDEGVKKLLVIVETDSRYDNQAAKILAQSGHIQELMEIGRKTKRLSTLYAIAQTQDVRLLSLFVDMLKENPENKDVIGALGYMKNKSVTPTLIELLHNHPDSDRPSEYDYVGVILTALMRIGDTRALPEISNRYEMCQSVPRKLHYAKVMVALGDLQPVPFMIEILREDIKGKKDRKASDYITFLVENGYLEDEALLPVLIDGLLHPDSLVMNDCIQSLQKLTRHNFGGNIWGRGITEEFPKAQKEWRAWLKAHQYKHPVYSRALDQAAKTCIDRFEEKLCQLAKSNKIVKWMKSILPKAQNGYGWHNNYLWKIENHPRLVALTPLSFQDQADFKDYKLFCDNRADYKLLYDISLITRAQEYQDVIFQEEFPMLNIVVRLVCTNQNEDVKNALRKIARESCAPLRKYERQFASKHSSKK